MNSSPPFRCPDGDGRRAARSFTLVEILAAVAVLAIILALVARIMALAGATWTQGKKRANNFVKARAALDIVTRDVQQGIFRDDMPAFSAGGGVTNAFYTLRQSGSQAGGRSLSLVCYQIQAGATNAMLQRMAAPLPWGTPLPFGQGTIPTATFTNAQDIVDGVLCLAVSFVRPDGVLTNAYTAGVKAIGIDLVVVDDSTLDLLNRTGKLGPLLGDAAFSVPAVLTVTNTPGQVWRANIDRAAGAAHPLPYASYPAGLGEGIRCFERYVPLP